MQQAATYIREIFAVTEAGRSNVVADALSRQFHDAEDEGQAQPHILFALSSPIPSLLSELKKYNSSDKGGKEFISQFCQRFKESAHVRNDLLFFKGRLVIPEANMRQKLLTEFHSSPMAGHSGIHKTLARLAACFYWPGMYRDAKNFVLNCIISIIRSLHHMGHMRPSHKISSFCCITRPFSGSGSGEEIRR